MAAETAMVYYYWYNFWLFYWHCSHICRTYITEMSFKFKNRFSLI
jgi:hypothetical protein